MIMVNLSKQILFKYKSNFGIYKDPMNNLPAVANFMTNVQHTLAGINASLVELRKKVEALESGSTHQSPSLDMGLVHARVDALEQLCRQAAKEVHTPSIPVEVTDRITRLEHVVTSLQAVNIDDKIKSALTSVLEGLQATSTSTPQLPATNEPVMEDDIQINHAPATKKSITRKAKSVQA